MMAGNEASADAGPLGSVSQQEGAMEIDPKKRKGKAGATRGRPPNRSTVSKPDSSKSKPKTGKQVKEKNDNTDAIRTRASPWRLTKVNDGLIGAQKIAILDTGLGGLLNIGSSSMPVDLSQWVMRCYDPVKSQLVIPDRGTIPVDAESVRRIWGLSNSGLQVCWEMQRDVIRTINEEYGFPGTHAPDLTKWCQMIKDMKGASDVKFVRAWSVVAFSCFLAPTTSVKVSPRSYLVCSDVQVLRRTNISQFVIDQIRQAFMKLGNKKSVCCCVYHLMLVYLDSLEVDEMISECDPRVSAWNISLIRKVMKMDLISPGVFGRLQLKEKYRDTVQGNLFGGLVQAEQFFAANLPADYDQCKKRKISAMIHSHCTDFEESMVKLVKEIGKLDEGVAAGKRHVTNTTEQTSSKRQRRSEEDEVPVLPVDDESKSEEIVNDLNPNDDDNEDNSEDDKTKKNADDEDDDDNEDDDDDDDDDDNEGSRTKSD